jgi:predicted Holliday junction resolvase-like endonuclease
MDIFLILVLFIFLCISLFGAYFIGYKFGAFRKDKYWQLKLPEYRKESLERSRAVLTGQFSEHFAPFLPGFEFNPVDCKFLGKPVDFLVFKGLSKKEIDEVVFVEVKSGKSNLSEIEKKLKKAIEEKRVRWKKYSIPKN